MNATTANISTLRVLLPLPLGGGYDYLAPEGTEIPPGTFVRVPLGSKESVGVVWGPGSGEVPLNKLKEIKGVLDPLPLNESMRRFVDWVASYTLTPPGLVLKMVMGGSWRPLKAHDKIDASLPDPDATTTELTPSQKNAAECLAAKVKDKKFSVTLLDGVTGSGKTEVYAESLAQAFRMGRQALVLLPEISMTAALYDRLTKRFGIAPTLWHSGLGEKQRRLNWHAIREGKAAFILGARSALFLPYPDLGVIVVDEEHEAAYKQEEGALYHGRDMAVVKGQCDSIPVILASATPSLETLNNVRKEKYDCVKIDGRYGKAKMPTIETVDLRREKLSAQSFISAPLFQALQETVAAKRQAMLFLNRRGYAPLTLCRGCGFRVQCPSCTSWLIEHKRTKRLHCHQCGYSRAVMQACPACGAEDKFAACGPGIERIAEEVATRLPEARYAIMASDTLAGPEAAQELVRQMQDQSLDLLIGTQIMAKGYHFPRLTLVGVIDADLGLAGGDPRAAERTFQLLQQVAGRSGRAEDAGRVYLQTTAPDHPVMRALVKGDRDAFMQAEMREREAYRLPPFGRLASITVSGPDKNQVAAAAQKIASSAPQNGALRVLGPAPAPVALLRGKTRYRLMAQAANGAALSAAIQSWIGAVSLPRNVKVQVDIDPYSFL